MTIYGKKRALSTLHDFRRSERFPHALLFYGAKGIGKHTLAKYTAMMYLCEKGGETPCMECNTCRRIEQQIHPDVTYPLALSDNGKYHIGFLREFIAACYLKPNDTDIRVCVFESLDEMTPLCQNSLLKFIEEPLPFNRYIFLAENKAPILQTVMSRITALEVDPADENSLTGALAEHGVSAEKAHELYLRCGGNIGAALELSGNTEEMQQVSTAVKVCAALADSRELDCYMAFASLKTRDEIFESLGILSDIFAQTAAYRSGRPVSGVFTSQIKKLSSRFALKKITRLYEESSRLYRLSFTNPNVKLFAAQCCASLFRAAESD